MPTGRSRSSGRGPIRVARQLPIGVIPHRFRTRGHFWSHCGLAIVTQALDDPLYHDYERAVVAAKGSRFLLFFHLLPHDAHLGIAGCDLRAERLGVVLGPLLAQVADSGSAR